VSSRIHRDIETINGRVEIDKFPTSDDIFLEVVDIDSSTLTNPPARATVLLTPEQALRISQALTQASLVTEASL